MPFEQAAAHVVGVEARLGEGLGRHRRATAAAAVEDDRRVAVDLAGPGGEL